MKRIALLALVVPALALGQDAAPQLQEDPRAARYKDVERGIFVAFETGYLRFFDTPAADLEQYPLAAEGGAAGGFPTVGVLLGADLGSRLSLALFFQGANLATSTDYGAFSLYAGGLDAKVALLAVRDRNDWQRFFVSVHARGGLAWTSPEGLFSAESGPIGSDELVFAAGPGIEYYTRLRHFSIALTADLVYASNAGELGFAVYPTVRYTF